ncbi:Tm-1-like ATP-binding domain-containing protein [Thermorudis peleae]|uniref:Tm-1-like ATP-binding domain-containing protein n=1 Tax=Thermorudis peleae TaxID=1382356 RepID=UPI00056F8AE9|nr:Tm-1-like ATP-binding domain-containing protein [Thermorudis peleae]
MPTVVLVGTLDTKGAEYGYVRDRLRAAGCEVILVDAGVLGEPLITPDISRAEVARAAGTTIEALVAQADRGTAIETMARGATQIVRTLFQQGKLHGILGLGGSGGSALVTAAMRALPIGVPKLMVSTLAAGDTRPYIGVSDIALLYPVVDIAGLNRLSEQILANAAGAIAGMAQAYEQYRPPQTAKPLIGATMFGVTTPCVTAARQRLEELGYEVLVFHATGTGGRAMEALVTGGFLAGVLDITTTELADELVGGVLSAGPERLEAAGAMGIPQVVSLGALDMVNFGPIDTVPERFRHRRLYKHNPTVTLMRTTPEECAELGRIIAQKLNQARGPVVVFIPKRGVSAIATEGGPFYDPDADQALFTALKAHLRPDIPVEEWDTDINDPAFARAMAERLAALIEAQAPGGWRA